MAGRPYSPEGAAQRAADPDNFAWETANPEAEVEEVGDGTFQARPRPWEGKEWFTKIYVRLPDPSMENRLKEHFVKKVAKTEIDDAWLQSNGYFGEFKTVRYWRGADTKDYKQNPNFWTIVAPLETAPKPVVTPSGEAAPAGARPAGEVPGALVNVISQDDQEMKLLTKLKMFKEILMPSQTEPTGGPGSPFGQKALEESFERRLQSLDQREAKLMKREADIAAPVVRPPVEVTKPKPDGKETWIEELTREYLPKLKKWIDRLIEPSALGKDLRADILASELFKSVMNDPDKRLQAQEFLVSVLGDKGLELAKFLEQEATNAAP